MSIRALADPTRYRHLPNALSALRLGFVPVLMTLAWYGQGELFAVALAGALSTDVLDGFLARRLGFETDLGTQLDSRADLAIWLSLPLCAWWLRPEVVRAEAAWIAVALVAALVPIGAGLIRYRRLTSYHTWGAKTASIAMGLALLAMFATGIALPLRLAIAVLVVSQLEEIAITATLARWHANVPSIRHARRIAASE